MICPAETPEGAAVGQLTALTTFYIDVNQRFLINPRCQVVSLSVNKRCQPVMTTQKLLSSMLIRLQQYQFIKNLL